MELKPIEERIANNKYKDYRGRCWAFLIYPTDENNPDNWLEIMKDLYLPACISPLHDKDVKKDGTPDKPHHHVMIRWDNTQRIEAAQKISDMFTGVAVQGVSSPKGYYHYYDHADEDDKVKYNIKDTICLSGFNPDKLEEVTNEELRDRRLRIEQFIRENKIFEYWELCSKLASHDLILKDYADTHSIEMCAKLKSYAKCAYDEYEKELLNH